MNRGRHVVLLVGPKGVGKSTIGRLLGRTYELAHVDPEPLWLEHATRREAFADPAAWEHEGFARVARAVQVALGERSLVVTDTTAASDQTPAFVAALARGGTLHVLRLSAREETCRARIRARDASRQLPTTDELIARTYARSLAARLPATSTIALDVEASLPAPIFLLPWLRGALLRSGVPIRTRVPTLTTPRTLLRAWRAEDRAPFAAINADPAVAAHLVSALSPAETDGLLGTIGGGFDTYGFGPWALEVPGEHALAGFCGLWVPTFEAPFLPAVEIAWRLCPSAWGHGYVTEAARAALAHAFETLELPEVVSFASGANVRSIAVMERLGMERDPAGDFEHPRVPLGHRLRPHVLYRLRREVWRGARHST